VVLVVALMGFCTSLLVPRRPAANASAQRIYEVIDSEPEVKEKPNAVKLENVRVESPSRKSPSATPVP
jgi:hypothetical protein